MKKLIKKISIAIPLAIIYFYRYVISPYTPRACRYEPSCSVYSLEAYKTHGLFKGGYLSFKRIFSCHPWGGQGWDPVPEKKKKSND